MNKEKMINTLIGLVHVPIIIFLGYLAIEALMYIGSYLFVLGWAFFG